MELWEGWVKTNVRGFLFFFPPAVGKEEDRFHLAWIKIKERRAKAGCHLWVDGCWSPLRITRLFFFYLLSAPLQTSFEFSIFCNLGVSEPDITLRLPLTPDTGQAAPSITCSNWVLLPAVYWQNKTWELGASLTVLRPVDSPPLPVHHRRGSAWALAPRVFGPVWTGKDGVRWYISKLKSVNTLCFVSQHFVRLLVYTSVCALAEILLHHRLDQQI